MNWSTAMLEVSATARGLFTLIDPFTPPRTLADIRKLHQPPPFDKIWGISMDEFQFQDPFSTLEPMEYAGIGSRRAPPVILKWAMAIGAELSKRNLILRSGAADGMDRAFEDGCDTVSLWNKEIFLPWRHYNGHGSIYYEQTPEAFRIASLVHPYWAKLEESVRKLHARNTHILLGKDCRSPVSFVVCWTPNGEITGGTGQALRIATSLRIPIYNLATLAKQRKIEIPF